MQHSPEMSGQSETVCFYWYDNVAACHGQRAKTRLKAPAIYVSGLTEIDFRAWTGGIADHHQTGDGSRPVDGCWAELCVSGIGSQCQDLSGFYLSSCWAAA